MELSRIITARAVWLFDLAELNPRGRRVDPILESVKARYRFAELSPDDKKTGMIFKNGVFTTAADEITIDSLELFQDGIVVNTRSDTADSEAVLDDAISWLWSEHGLGSLEFRKRPRRFYVSELVVYCPDVNLERGLGTLLTIKDAIADATGTAKSEVGAQAVVFGSSERRNLFTFERRAGEPYSTSKYFSSALMRTSDHMSVLEQVVTLLST